MLIAQNANKQIKIEDHLKQKYVDLKWDIYDEEGKLIHSSKDSEGVKLTDSQKKVFKALSTIDINKDLTLPAVKSMAEVLGVEFVDKEKSGEELQNVFSEMMSSIKF